MCKRPYWVQRADYSSRDYPPVSLTDAEIALRGHNWQLELAFKRTLDASGEDACLPGIGFTADGENSLAVLHICPGDDGSAHCFFQQGTSICDGVEINPVGQYRLLQLFFRGDYNGVIRALEGNW